MGNQQALSVQGHASCTHTCVTELQNMLYCDLCTSTCSHEKYEANMTYITNPRTELLVDNQ